MRTLYDVPAPAKLNLFLHITGRRADGYHLLQSVFMLIDWCDTLHFEKRGDGIITREDLTLALPKDDLCTRAARALQAATGCTHGAHISVIKQIPAQAGMGGGSSDAASTLLALNRLWGLNLPGCELERIGLSLGADVPFFLRGHNAWIEGVGEQITPLQGDAQLPDQKFLVIKPEAGLETSAIFSSESLKRNTETATMTGFAAAHYCFGRNDLQPVAQALCPDVTAALEWLQQQGLQARMTGSGSAVFAPIGMNFGSASGLIAAPQKWQTKVCNNMEIHPLLGWAP